MGGQPTFTGTHPSGEDAPIAAVPVDRGLTRKRSLGLCVNQDLCIRTDWSASGVSSALSYGLHNPFGVQSDAGVAKGFAVS